MSIEFTPRGYHNRSVFKPVSPVTSSQNFQLQQPYESNFHQRNASLEGKRSQNQSSYPNSPRTPRKNHTDSYQSDPSAAENGSGHKSRTKSRPKNFMTFPAMNKKTHNISPRSGSHSGATPSNSVSTPVTTAYAGPTFHSSPAPSTLPIPSFYSKSVPASPSHNIPRPFQGQGKTTSPSNLISSSQSLKQDSPLRLLFKSHESSISSIRDTETYSSSAAEFASESDRHQLISPRYTGYSSSNDSSNEMGRKYNTKTSSSEMLSMELGEESDSTNSFGAPFPKSFSESLKAISPDEDQRTNSTHQTFKKISYSDNAEALKAYLFSGHLMGWAKSGSVKLS